ncbi:MAG: NAD(P)H-quinone oxidoreductase chain 4 [Turneriella sp.]|nr:NAD(P)H-quinone oxidoreductase chain 4 [Turneriella sp.]
MIAVSILVPAAVAILILALREEKAPVTWFSRNAWLSIGATLVSLFACFVIVAGFHPSTAAPQFYEVWWNGGQSGFSLTFALDGISLPLFVTTAFLFFIAVVFSLGVFKEQGILQSKIYWGMLLLLESTILGVFAAWNLILFYAFWELFLVPVVYLVWRFGLEERKRAAMQFFLYTFLSSVFMLAAFAAFVYYTPRIGVDFNIRQNIAQDTQLLSYGNQKLVLIFLMLAFLAKMPVLPFHSWLPLTHTQAPIGTLLLSGIILKLGSYGVLRFVTPNMQSALIEWRPSLIVLGLLSMFYGAFAAYRQKSFRYVIAYSSLSHMGLLFAGAITAHEYAITGSIIQNVGHSLTNALLFVLVCMPMVRNKSDEFGAMRAPKSFVYWAALVIAVFSAIGVPGTIGFVGEFFILFGFSYYSWPITIFAVLTIVISAAYMLRLFHKVRATERDVSWRPNTAERVCLVLLSATIIWFGVAPSALGDIGRTAAKTSLAAPANPIPQGSVQQ